MAYVNKNALSKTIETGNAWFWSTSHNRLWMKGEESGNIQPVKKILVDCDSDAFSYIWLILLNLPVILEIDHVFIMNYNINFLIVK